MIDWLIWVVLGALVFASYLDLKYRGVPSVALTGLVFLVAVLRVDQLAFGVLAFLMAWTIKDLIYEFQGLEFGMADIKIMVVIGLLIPNLYWFLMFVAIFSVYQFVYTAVWQWRVGHDKERPFIPCLLAVYVTMMIIGGLA